jgi:hypothetical protein
VLARRARGPGGGPSRPLGAGDGNAFGPQRSRGHAPIGLGAQPAGQQVCANAGDDISAYAKIGLRQLSQLQQEFDPHGYGSSSDLRTNRTLSEMVPERI